MRFTCFECPGRTCSCWSECTHKRKTNEENLKNCPHKENSLYKEENGSLTTKKDCFACGAHFTKIEIKDIENVLH